jgi:UDP:flavonoid glycosyltransferase YjiC (YdhE family)
MSRFLLASSPQSGHFNPATAIARELVRRGHEVGWYVGERYRAKVEALGARHFPMKAAPDFDENDINSAFPGRTQFKGFAQLKWDLKHFFIDPSVGQLADLTEILRDFPADVLLTDPGIIGALMLSEKGGPPWAVYGIIQITLLSPDAAPMGLGLVPRPSWLGRCRNRFLNWFANAVLFRDVQNHLDKVRASVGLPPLGCFLLDGPALRSRLYLQGTTKAFEYPMRNLPPHLHFVGPLLPPPAGEFTPPAWWNELQSGRPVILVTQGVIALDYQNLLIPALQGLSEEDVVVVATTGGKPVESVDLRPLPANVRMEPFIPYHQLLPHVDVMVTNGGYGGTHFALAHGVPIVAAGITEGKIDVCARIEWAGVGINLRTEKPTQQQIREAVKRVLADSSYKKKAQQIQVDFARHDAAARSVELLEELALTAAG